MENRSSPHLFHCKTIRFNEMSLKISRNYRFESLFPNVVKIPFMLEVMEENSDFGTKNGESGHFQVRLIRQKCEV